MQLKKIKVSDLFVNTDNFRFDSMAGQKEAIEKMLDELGEKVLNLARHIVENGLNPADIVQVAASRHDKTKYNVLEGNRRLVALKLLNNPDLADSPGHASLKRRFRKLHEDNKAAIPKEAQCLVWDNPDDANKWIKLKHTGANEGIGTVDWTTQQQDRFDEKVEGKSSIALQVVKLLSGSAEVPQEVREQLPELKVTNLDRMISDPDVRDVLGIQVSKGLLHSDVDKGEVIKGLTKLVKDILDPKFNVADIYTKQDRKDYLSKFGKASKPDLKKTAAKPWDFNDGRATSGKTTKVKKNPNHRNVLIPKSCVIKIDNPKLNEIYHELQTLNVHKHKHACSVAFRVFVEQSLDCYMESHKDVKANMDSKLLQKVTEVANHLETNGFADKHICKGIRSAANNQNDLLGINTWHAYVHNKNFSPTAENLITSWNNIQPFIEKVWGNIK